MLFIGVGKMLASRCWQNWNVSGKCQLCGWISVSGAQSKKPFLWLSHMQWELGGALDETNMRKWLLLMIWGPQFPFPGESDSLMAWVVHSEINWRLLKINSYYQVSCPCMSKSFCNRLLEEKKTTDFFSGGLFKAIPECNVIKWDLWPP